MAISAFGLTTRGVTTLATTADADNTRYRLFLFNVTFAFILLPLLVVFLLLQGTPLPLVVLLVAHTICTPAQFDWADHGANNYRRPLLKNGLARTLSLGMVGALVALDQVQVFALSAALLVPLIVVNIATYRRWLRSALDRRGRDVNLDGSLRLLVWPGAQRIATSTYANLDVLLIPLYFAGAQSVALLYIYRLLKALMGFLLGGLTSLLPRLARQAAGASPDASIPLGLLFAAVLLTGLMATLGLLVAREDVLLLLGAANMDDARSIYGILVLAVVPMMLNNLLANMLFYPKQQESRVLISTLLVIIITVPTLAFCKTVPGAAMVFLGAECGLLMLNGVIALLHWRRQ